MHNAAREQVAEFVETTRPNWPKGKAADLGALNLSGSVKEFLPDAVGFDIVEGPSIDVVIEPGEIPNEHKGKYSAVVSVSSFQFCGKPRLYRQEAADLLCKGGWLMVTMCGPNCPAEHNTSKNAQGWGDVLRWELSTFFMFWDAAFRTVRVQQLDRSHRDLIYWGCKR